MDIVITAHNTPEYLLIESKGEVKNAVEVQEHCKRIFDEILRYGNKKVLVDEPGTSFPRNMLIYYDLVTYYLENFPPEIRFIKVAVVIAEEFKEIGYFWETVCVNKGLRYFAFTSLEEARDWLLK
jgi:hypothetical protein